MTVPFTVLIPARYGSSRLPGKPLLLLAGKPLIQHVHERALESGARRVVIATDDERIHSACEKFGAQVCMTAAQHPSGTDRLADAARQLRLAADEIVVNLQGDEPLMLPQLLTHVAENLHAHADAQMATLCVAIHDAAELFNPHAVKVVMDQAGYALYFSRAPIPWQRDAFAARPNQLPPGTAYYRHLGLYAYRAGFLAQFVTWPSAPLEQAEALEQLRALWNGQRIHVAVAEQVPPPGVDTPEDLELAERLLRDGLTHG
ncbi:MAG: 3-deoxy-manno-octulosonate cytidylyltransferase [Gammaproteobacteria bacterium]|nr:3-deoxy-manno-octulosonate cytidylyltransferase [Gammaproteobacteria bacterium]